jgi:hypothetical protein
MEPNTDNTGGDNQLEQTVASIIGGGGQDPTPPVAPPEKIGEVTIDQFNSLLEQATGGTIKGWDDLQSNLQISQQFPTVKQQLEEFKAKSQMPQFPNDFAKETVDFFSKGGTIDEFYRFVDLQRMDTEQMEALDLVRWDYQQKYPSFTSEQIDNLISKDIGRINPETRTEKQGEGEEAKEVTTEIPADPTALAELARRAHDVRKAIEQKKVQVKTPQAAADNEAQQQQFENTSNLISQLTGFALNDFSKVNFKFEGVEGEGFDFPIPKEFEGQLKTLTSQLVMQEYMAGKFELNQQTFNASVKPMIEQTARQLVLAQYGDKMIEAAYRHALEEGSNGRQRRQHNVPPRGQQQRQENSGNKMPEWKKQLRAKEAQRLI